MSEVFAIDVASGGAGGTESVTARVYAPVSSSVGTPALILGHGAGANQSSEFMVSTSMHLAARGIEVITFNFIYTEKKKRVPDRPDVLEATWRAVLASTRARIGDRPLFAGGKSMGGRIASQIAADPAIARELAGLVFLGYPLHPPKKPTQLRSKHLPKIKSPMLFIQGARDAFGTEDEMTPLAHELGADLYVIPLGDHSFAVPKKSGTPQNNVYSAIEERIVRFVTEKAAVRSVE